jgi:hypothetical protein
MIRKMTKLTISMYQLLTGKGSKPAPDHQDLERISASYLNGIEAVVVTTFSSAIAG